MTEGTLNIAEEPKRLLNEFTKSYLIELGDIVVAMGHLEENLAVLMRTMADNMELGNLLVAGRHLGDVLDLLSAAFYSSPKKKSESVTFEYLLSRIREVNEERNDNIHAQWFFVDDEKQAVRFKVVKHKRGTVSAGKAKLHVPLSVLEQLKTDILNLIVDIDAFRVVNFLSARVEFKIPDLPILKMKSVYLCKK